jgi:tetratricopeptide (TPR) repeat protein
MESRLAATDRPEEENPYFYLLLMGDVELSRGDTVKALAFYEEAEQKGVASPLTADRYRAVAAWHEEHGQLKEAIDLLSKYRDRDDLLFDSMLDRIAKKLTLQETEQTMGK